MLTGIHFLLTYNCDFECDHCFLYCSPVAEGTFTIGQVTRVLDEAHKIGTIKEVYFEGGEPFLFYPLLEESVRRAVARGFNVGVVTNGHGANSEEDAELALRPLAEAGLSLLSISNDTFHYGDEVDNAAATTARVAKRLGIVSSEICIEPPSVSQRSADVEDKGRPVVGGGVTFRGRAADKLTDDLPRRPRGELCECPYEELESPARLHVDSFGHVHICQGLSMGNMWETPLSQLVRDYDSHAHPVCGPLIQGGPAELAKALGVTPEAGYVDECHMCYSVRRAALDRLPALLAPRQVYGPLSR